MSDGPGNSIFEELYKDFSSPLTSLNCGEKCGPYNDYGVPVCCDIQLLVPAAYEDEWVYLEKSTDLWHTWGSDRGDDSGDLEQDLQGAQVLLECLGYQRCQRPYRSITCRAFPFYPYLNNKGEFSGLAYYRDFQEQCWIISNLDKISLDFIKEFQAVYLKLFDIYPDTRADYFEYSAYLRDQCSRRSENLILISFSGIIHLVDPATENISEINPQDLDSFGPFKITNELVFPDEINDSTTGNEHE